MPVTLISVGIPMEVMEKAQEKLNIFGGPEKGVSMSPSGAWGGKPTHKVSAKTFSRSVLTVFDALHNSAGRTPMAFMWTQGVHHSYQCNWRVANIGQ